MIKLTNNELNVLSEQVSECYPCEMLREIKEWQNSTKSDTIISVLDTVADIIINNTIWE